MSFKAWVLAAGETEYSTNALAFATEEEAGLYAANLADRWMAVRTWEVRPSDEPVTYTFTRDENGRASLAQVPAQAEPESPVG